MNRLWATRFTFQLALSATLVGFFCVQTADAHADSIPLAGEWRFQLDREDAGVKERWCERSLDQHIKLPGALQNQGFGDDITVDTKWTGDVGTDAWRKGAQYEKYRQPGNIKVPFFLQPEKHFVGSAWYQRDVDIPAAWRGKRVVLSLERAHWETRLWLEGERSARIRAYPRRTATTWAQGSRQASTR
jgi:beta-galactosidase/beta-glucuronidase